MTTWGIYSYSVGFPRAGGFIESSIGRPYRELQSIARRMGSNGEDQRYEVRRTWAVSYHDGVPIPNARGSTEPA